MVLDVLNSPFLLTQACREGDLVVLSTLLENNVNDPDEPNENGLSPLHYAARNDQGQAIQLLIDHGAGKSINQTGIYSVITIKLKRHRYNVTGSRGVKF